ncbi:MAG: DUF354 domain-containing protein [Cyclobacteriaceae bacterium]
MVDIAHPAHVNFFKKALRTLRAEGHEVIITGLRRGKLPRILENEMSEYPIYYVGKHEGTKYSIIVDANLRKMFNLLYLVNKHRIDFGLSVGSFTLGTALKLRGKPNIQFDDDPERTMNVLLEKLTCTRLYFPPVIESNGKVGHMKALKEWAYLSPRYFEPDPSVLQPYGIAPGEYIFVREVSSGSLNYLNQASNTVASFADKFPKGYKVLLSLEDKQYHDVYPEDWILLQEPLPDIHSLLYYSRMIVSSGDSMAREGALLGVPSIYAGIREMKANQLMKDRRMLFKLGPEEAPDFMADVVDGLYEIQEQQAFRRRLAEEWDDVTDFILQQVHRYKK